MTYHNHSWTASEQLYAGAPLAHVVMWEELNRLARIDRQHRLAAGRGRR